MPCGRLISVKTTRLTADVRNIANVAVSIFFFNRRHCAMAVKYAQQLVTDFFESGTIFIGAADLKTVFEVS